MSEGEMIRVEVAYALPHRQAIVPLDVEAGTTALQAAHKSGLDTQFEELDVDNARLGIFGKVVSPGQVLHDGDRVEIYRPLIADPKQVRKERAARAREKRAAARDDANEGPAD
jgi:putative ubiquitin-RnfH superfamily antitoxin RatB of RatAB toxin-antitoxin module